MTNKELINGISAQTGMTKKKAGELLDTTMELMLNAVLDGKTIQVNEFGTFEVRKKNERVTVHPITKVRTITPPKQQLVFKLSPSLKEKLNER